MKSSGIRWIGAVPKKPLRPMTITVVGPLTLGLATAVAVFVTHSEEHRWSGLLVAFGSGAALGFTVFAPISLALAFRARLADWLERYGFHFQ